MNRLIFRSTLFAAAAFLANSVFPQASPSPSSPPNTKQPSVVTSSSRFTIAFWNIEWFPGKGPDARPGDEQRQAAAVHTDISQLKPDILGMEEIRDFASAGLAVQPLAGFKVDVCANFPPREGQNVGQQPALASRYPAMSAWTEEWKAAGAMVPPRGFAFAAYEVAPGRLVLVYCVHLKSNRGQDQENVSMRQESARQLLSHVKAMEEIYGKIGKTACIIGGDFNTSLDDQRFNSETTLRDLMKNGFLWAFQGMQAASRVTMPSSRDFPPAYFDHIFYRGLKLQSARVANTSAQSSDHRAILATFDLPPN